MFVLSLDFFFFFFFSYIPFCVYKFYFSQIVTEIYDLEIPSTVLTMGLNISVPAQWTITPLSLLSPHPG